ncbi:MAG TPA: LssY C-terminal domain-containing protein [Candidatus Dormibacteraeota bacterium]|nr:LssY C-terminal domain-containing protein [Candidatus Dormibacteraeota bacterium]
MASPLFFGSLNIRLGLVAAICILLSAAHARSVPAQIKSKAAHPSGRSESVLGGLRHVYQELSISGDQSWTDSGIDLHPGDRLTITAKGVLEYLGSGESGPEGLPRTYKDLLRILPINQAGRGALIGRIGDAEIAQPFVVGSKHAVVVRRPGRLFIGINQPADDWASGSFTVHIELVASPNAAAATTPDALATSIPAVTAEFLKKIPRRVADKDGNLGDITNFLLIGSEKDLLQAFQDAGWVKVDANPDTAILHIILASLSKESYVHMPMSELYLLGRVQDYGFAHADPLTVVATRHHLRLWKSALRIEGRAVWIGAATHDIGFELDQRNDNITHKIDPDVDLERDFVGKSLSETGRLSALAHVLPPDAVKEEQTATGGSFHSNGEVLVMRLTHSADKLDK